MIRRNVCQLLAPFLAGQLLRRWIGGFVTRHQRILGFVDRGSVLLVVYTAFSQGVVEGIWGRVTPLQLVALIGVEAALLALMLALTWYGSRRLGFARSDRLVTVFAGSNKSLAAGLPMASVLFGAQASLAVLPLMLFHQMQLIVCAFLSRRWARRAPDVRVAEGTTRTVAAGGPQAPARGERGSGSAASGGSGRFQRQSQR